MVISDLTYYGFVISSRQMISEIFEGTERVLDKKKMKASCVK